jgi:hypothetical protein
MADQRTKEKHSRRLLDDETHVKKRYKLLKEKNAYFSGNAIEKQPHRLHKVSGMNCGNPDCLLCMNPRKAWKEKTMQEQSFEQTEEWREE